MRLNQAGRMVRAVWEELPVHYPQVETDAFVVMPNHIHGIIVLTAGLVGAAPRGRPEAEGPAQGPAPTAMSLIDCVHRFKTMTTRKYSQGVRHSGWPSFVNRLWQRGYYERVVRRCEDINRIRAYILDNPPRWERDRENIRRT